MGSEVQKALCNALHGEHKKTAVGEGGRKASRWRRGVLMA